MIKKTFQCLAFALLCSTSIYAQEIAIKKTESDSIPITQSSQPQFKYGGLKGFMKFVYAFYKIPEAYQGSGIMMVRFKVDIDGQLTDIKVINAIFV